MKMYAMVPSEAQNSKRIGVMKYQSGATPLHSVVRRCARRFAMSSKSVQGPCLLPPTLSVASDRAVTRRQRARNPWEHRREDSAAHEPAADLRHQSM